MSPDPALMPAVARSMAFRAWFGLQVAQADLLAVIYGASGAIGLAELSARSGVSRGAILWHIYEIRRALETEALDRNGEGYLLTAEGRAECRAALWTLGEELRGAA